MRCRELEVGDFVEPLLSVSGELSETRGSCPFCKNFRSIARNDLLQVDNKLYSESILKFLAEMTLP